MRNFLIALLIVATFAVPSFGKTAARWRHGVLEYYDTDTGKATVIPMADFYFVDEFLGSKFEKIIANENTVAPWTTVETSLNTAVAVVADGVPGQLGMILDSDSNAERAVIYWGDQESVSIDDGCVFEARVQWSVLQTGVSTCVVGLAGADNANPDIIDVCAWFRVDFGDSDALLWETDDNVTNDDDNAAQAIVVSTWYVLRIDAYDEDTVKFYVNGSLVGTGSMAGLTSDTGKIQPYIAIQKATGTGVGTLLVDYVKLWGWRP